VEELEREEAEGLPSRLSARRLVKVVGLAAMLVVAVAALHRWTSSVTESRAAEALAQAFARYVVALRGDLPEAWSIEQVLEHHAVERVLDRDGWTAPKDLGDACRDAFETRFGISDRDELCLELRPYRDCGQVSSWATTRADVIERAQRLRSCASQLERRWPALITPAHLLDGTEGSPLVDPSPFQIPEAPSPLKPTSPRVGVFEGGIVLLWQSVDTAACRDGGGRGGCDRFALVHLDWEGRLTTHVPENPAGLWAWTRAVTDELGRLVASGTCRDEASDPMRYCVLRESIHGDREALRVELDLYPQLSRLEQDRDAPLPLDAPTLVREVASAYARPILGMAALSPEARIWESPDTLEVKERPLELSTATVALRRTRTRLVLERRDRASGSMHRITILSGSSWPARLVVGPSEALVVVLGHGAQHVVWSRDGGNTWEPAG
jgi:hypothetical protein